MTDDLILQAREMQKRMIATTLPGELADALEAQAREIDRLRDEYIAYMESQLKKDARIAELEELFEWLEGQAKSSYTGISFDWVPSVEGEPKGWRFMRRHYVSEPGKSLIEAIRAARAALEKKDD